MDHTDPGLALRDPGGQSFRGRTDARPGDLGRRLPRALAIQLRPGDGRSAGDVGRDRVEEVSTSGAARISVGMSTRASLPFSNRYRRDGVTYTPPVFAYRRKFGNSVTGGFVYRGDPQSPLLRVYICGDYTSHRIWGVKQEGRLLQSVRQIATSRRASRRSRRTRRGTLRRRV